MIETSRQQLIGYLLQALEPDEHQKVAEELRASPELRRDLARLKKALDLPEADAEMSDPPPGLAEKTCILVRCVAGLQSASREFISYLPELSCSAAPDEHAIAQEKSDLPAVAPQGEEFQSVSQAASSAGAQSAKPELEVAAIADVPRSRRSRVIDACVACAVLAMIGGTIVPQMVQSHAQALRNACNRNLAVNHSSYARYADASHGWLPTASQSGPLAFAGMVGPSWQKAGLLENPRALLCPESNAATEPDFQVPPIDVLERATPETLVVMQRTAGGTYAYPLGYYENGIYHRLKYQARKHFPLMADLPATDGESGLHHGCEGYSVLYEDGHYEFLSMCDDSCRCTPMFYNEHGVRKAGVHREDAVLAESAVAP